MTNSRRVRNVGPGTVVAAPRELRRESTPAEVALWDQLRGRQLNGLKFRRRQAIGSFILDFVGVENRFVVEVDGIHHVDHEQEMCDADRTDSLESYGYTVIRFTNDQILNDIGSVIDLIDNHCTVLKHRTPLPELGEGQG